MRSDETGDFDEARFWKGSMSLAEAGGAAVCGGRSGAESGEADGELGASQRPEKPPGTLCRTVGRLNTS